MEYKKSAFLEYLKAKHHKIYEKEIREFFLENSDIVIDSIENSNYLRDIEIENLDYKTVCIDDGPEDTIYFDVAIDVEYLATVSLGKYHDERTIGRRKWVLACCKGDLSKRLRDIEIIGVEEFSKAKPKKPLSGDLVPIIYRNEFSKYAEEILKKYYPEAIKSTSAVDIEELARRMGLTIHYKKISEENSVFGLLFFTDGATTLYSKKEKIWKNYRVKANTIIVDKGVNFLYSFGTYKLTIAHECVHFALHRKSFLFSRLFHQNLKIIECEVNGGIKGINTGAREMWMEVQANGIAPYLLIPTESFTQKVKELTDKYQCQNNTDLLNKITFIIDELAEHYGVTRDAIRKRLTDIGYEEASGAFNFVDGQYIRPYRYPKQALKDLKVYSIPAEELKFLMMSSIKLRESIKSGHYIYVESHLVLNHPKYIEKNLLGHLQLTDYARENIDECCIAFRIEYKNKNIILNDYYAICYLNHNIKTEFEYGIVFKNDYENADEKIKNEVYKKALNEEQELFLVMNQSFTDCLKKVKKWRGVSYQWIADKIRMDVRTIERTFNGLTEPTIKTLCAILLALKTPYKISEHIINLSPNQFNFQIEEHWNLNQLLMVNNKMEMGQIFSEAEKLNIHL